MNVDEFSEILNMYKEALLSRDNLVKNRASSSDALPTSPTPAVAPMVPPAAVAPTAVADPSAMDDAEDKKRKAQHDPQDDRDANRHNMEEEADRNARGGV